MGHIRQGCRSEQLLSGRHRFLSVFMPDCANGVAIAASPEVVGNQQPERGNDLERAGPTATTTHELAISARSAGVAVINMQGSPPTREQLVEQGIEPHQADALLVRMNQEEVLMQNFRCWILCFSCTVSLLMPAMLGILIWMGIEYVNNRKKDCDVPLRTWVHVVVVVMVYNSTVNRPGQNGSFITRVFCQWQPDPQTPSPMPARVRIYNAVVALLIFSWTCLGIHWVHVSGTIESEYPPCSEVASGLYNSVKVYAAFNLAFTIFMYVNMIGFAQLLRSAMRRGLLHGSQAAPKGALQANTERPSEDDPQLLENPTCSICLEDYGNLNAVSKTKTCGHLFHTQCLKNWLQVNRNCPLCRQDLGTIDV
jgi:hypothetical protein